MIGISIVISIGFLIGFLILFGMIAFYIRVKVTGNRIVNNPVKKPQKLTPEIDIEMVDNKIGKLEKLLVFKDDGEININVLVEEVEDD